MIDSDHRKVPSIIFYSSHLTMGINNTAYQQ